MIKKIITLFILILIFANKYTYATDEIISSQMDALNLSSFIEEGQNYTEEVFPEVDLNNFLNSAISGEVDNSKILNGILSLFGKEIVSTISLLGTILIVIIVHSLLKSLIDNLNNGESIGQIAYYVQYILIITLIMSNFTSIISMIKDSISNLVGFVNSLIPILLALMSATRKCSICNINSANNNICSYFYRKYNYIVCASNYFNCYSIGNCI